MTDHAFFSLTSRTLCAVLMSCMGFALSGCSSLGLDIHQLTTTISPYRMEVVQGNFVSKEQVEFLKPGMTRAQVRDVLGTPLMTSLFHKDRWDYVFTLRRQGITSQTRRLSVFFKGDVLERHEGDDMPSEAEFVAQLESSKKLGKIPELEASPDSLKKFAPTTPTQPRVAAPAPTTVTYPPLESPSR